MNDYEKYFEMVKKINPQIIAVTDGDPQLENKKKQIEALGGKVEIVLPYIPNLSTKQIIDRIA